MAFSNDTLFSATGTAPLLKRWDGEVVVYHPPSAETHLLDLPTAGLLSALRERSLSMGELRSVFIAEYGEHFPDGDSEPYLAEALEQLCAIDLIQAAEHASA